MPAERNHPVFREPDNLNVRVWRYMDFTKFVSLLALNALYFARSDLLGDAFEGAMPRDNFRFHSLLYAGLPVTPESMKKLSDRREQFRQQIYINCWHMNERESAAMWNLYVRSNEAIAVQSTYQLLHACLPARIYVGSVQYIDYENDFLPEDDLLRPFMHKRKSFEHERELRAIISLEAEDEDTWVGYTVGSVGRTVSIKLDDLIEKVYVAPTSPAWFADLVRSVMSKYGLDKPVVLSCLDEKPVF